MIQKYTIGLLYLSLLITGANLEGAHQPAKRQEIAHEHCSRQDIVTSLHARSIPCHYCKQSVAAQAGRTIVQTLAEHVRSCPSADNVAKRDTHICPLCLAKGILKRFNGPQQLDQHLNLHTQEMQLCTYCGKEFSNLYRHQLRFHRNGVPRGERQRVITTPAIALSTGMAKRLLEYYSPEQIQSTMHESAPCPHCLKEIEPQDSVTIVTTLAQHIRNDCIVTTADRKAKSHANICPLCLKKGNVITFDCLRELDRHIALHKEKQLCTECNTKVKNLYRHRLKHHPHNNAQATTDRAPENSASEHDSEDIDNTPAEPDTTQPALSAMLEIPAPPAVTNAAQHALILYTPTHEIAEPAEQSSPNNNTLEVENVPVARQEPANTEIRNAQNSTRKRQLKYYSQEAIEVALRAPSIRCSYCTQEVAAQDGITIIQSLAKHVRIDCHAADIAAKKAPYICPPCLQDGLCFRCGCEANLKTHFSRHRHELTQCPHCLKQFADIRSHILGMHQNLYRPQIVQQNPPATTSTADALDLPTDLATDDPFYTGDL